MKRTIIGVMALCLAALPTFGQDAGDGTQRPQVTLQNFEKCNNWARHYCIKGEHEEMVNAKLRRMKERGLQITTERIRQASRSTPRTNY